MKCFWPFELVARSVNKQVGVKWDEAGMGGRLQYKLFMLGRYTATEENGGKRVRRSVTL